MLTGVRSLWGKLWENVGGLGGIGCSRKFKLVGRTGDPA